MKATSIIMAIPALLGDFVIASPVLPQVDALATPAPTHPANDAVLAGAAETTCGKMYDKCKKHEDCCSCWCYNFLTWGHLCGGSANTHCPESAVEATAVVREIGAAATAIGKDFATITTAPIVGVSTAPTLHHGAESRVTASSGW